MALDVATIVATLEAEYTANLTKLSNLSALDVSDQGRSVNNSASRESLNKRQREIEKTLAQLGSPVGTIDVPFVSISKVRP